MTERNEKTTIGRSATKSKPTMEKEQGKAASPVTKGKSEEGRSASPGSAMSKKAMPKNEQPSTTEKGGGPKKGSM